LSNCYKRHGISYKKPRYCFYKDISDADHLLKQKEYVQAVVTALQ
jgi:hypothetical protein